MTKRVKTPVFRVFFPAVFEPKEFENNGKPKYSVQMVWDKDTDLTELEELFKETAKAKFGKVSPKIKNPLRDGDVDREGKRGYEHTVFATASSQFQPGIVDAKVQPITSRDEFYPGCYARATITAYAYDFKGNSGVAFNLCNLQKVKDGERIDGVMSAETEFETFDVNSDFGND